jgi:hypothetical protein
MDNSAVISDCGAYRYRLSREWEHGGQRHYKAVFLMLNPSTADATKDDPTIRKCIGFAKRWGMGGIDVVNLFAFRSTDPKALAALDPDVAVGPDNTHHVTMALGEAHRSGCPVVCAWGSTGGSAVKRMMAREIFALRVTWGRLDGFAFQCLGRSADGSPRHPLMLSYSTPLEPWSAT